MSCDWRFECVDCRTSYATERNHGGPCMAAILAARPELARLSAELKAHAALLENLSYFLATGDEPNFNPVIRLADWFRAHEGHSVKVISETGREYGLCGARVPCRGGCGHERHCTRPPDHDGDHDPEAQR